MSERPTVGGFPAARNREPAGFWSTERRESTESSALESECDSIVG